MKATLLFQFAVICSTIAVEEKPLPDYPFDKSPFGNEVPQKINEGGKHLISSYGDILFDHISFVPLPKPDEMDPSNSHTLDYLRWKTRYPVASLLIQGKEQTLSLLDQTDFFQISVPSGDLEMFSYVLDRMLGKEKALEFSARKEAGGNPEEKENWRQISEMLNNPLNADVKFFAKPMNDPVKVEAYRKLSGEYIEKRKAFRRSAAGGDPVDKIKREDYLKGIAAAISRYVTSKGNYPPDLAALVSSGLIQEHDLFYAKPDESLILPDYHPFRKSAPEPDSVILILPTEDGTRKLEAHVNGGITLTPPH